MHLFKISISGSKCPQKQNIIMKKKDFLRFTTIIITVNKYFDNLAKTIFELS
jgi:hypothetical protein